MIKKKKPLKKSTKPATTITVHAGGAGGQVHAMHAVHARSQKDNLAFLDGMTSHDSLAERLGEEFVSRALSGQDEGADILAEETPEDLGGPFVETEGDVEFAKGHDKSNPSWGTREPFPKT